MLRIYRGLALLALIPGCALFRGAPAQPKEALVPAPQASNEKKLKTTLFDLGACFPREVTVEGRPSRESIIGAVLSARPAITECLVDPNNRGTERVTKVNVDTIVSETGVEYKVTGDNLTASGQACAVAVLNARHAFDKSDSKGPPITNHAELMYIEGSHPAVVFGPDQAADLMNEIRLEQRSWCDCFEPWRNAAPQVLKSKLFIDKNKEGRTKLRVEFEPADGQGANRVQRCLLGKMEALPLPTKDDDLHIAYTFFLIHSGLDQELSEGPTELNFWHLRALRNQRAAVTAIKLAERMNAVLDYNALAAGYREKPEPSLLDKLKKSCAALTQADAAWIGALEQQLETDKRALTVASELGLSAPPDLEMLERRIGASSADVEIAKKTKLADGSACLR